VSLIRPRWLEDIVPPTPAGSLRIRNLKGFEPHHLPALQDELYADDPVFWHLSSNIGAGGAGNFGHVGVQTPNDDGILVIVDGFEAGCSSAADTFAVEVGLLTLVTDTSVIKRNRRESSRGPAFDRAGLLRITDNTVATAGTQIRVELAPVNVMVQVRDLHYRLYGNEQLFIRNGTANNPLTVNMWGRFLWKGAR
jgi:hypothetical protein